MGSLNRSAYVTSRETFTMHEITRFCQVKKTGINIWDKQQHILHGCVMVVCWTRMWKFDPRLREAKDKHWHYLFHIWAVFGRNDIRHLI